MRQREGEAWSSKTPTSRQRSIKTVAVSGGWQSPKTMFVSTLDRSMSTPGSPLRPSARRRALPWSSARRSTISSRAIQMYGKAGLVGDLAQGGGLRRAEAGSAFAIVGVLEAEESGYRFVDIGLADRAAYLLGLKAPVPAVQRSKLQAADDRRARHLVLKDMAVDLEDDLLSGLGVAEQDAEVAHRPARNKERRCLADNLRS